LCKAGSTLAKQRDPKTIYATHKRNPQTVPCPLKNPECVDTPLLHAPRERERDRKTLLLLSREIKKYYLTPVYKLSSTFQFKTLSFHAVITTDPPRQ
jgi:hypothetical protein